MSASQAPGLVAVHVPKTAGTSLRELLARRFGDGLRLDDGDRPLAHARWERRARALGAAWANRGHALDCACVCGHFMPLKYAWLRHARYAVWLRDPVQRVVSRYHHYRRHGGQEPQHLRWGLRPGLSLDAFVRLPQYRNTYAEYLWMFPLHRFDFVGLVERFDEDMARFARMFDLGDVSGMRAANANPDRAADGYVLDPAMERLIRRLNAKDVAIYEAARAGGGSIPRAAT